jgi:hypothetical protein
MVLNKHQLPSPRIRLSFHQLEIDIATGRFGQRRAVHPQDFQYQ